MILPFGKIHSYISFIKLLNFSKFTKIPIKNEKIWVQNVSCLVQNHTMDKPFQRHIQAS